MVFCSSWIPRILRSALWLRIWVVRLLSFFILFPLGGAVIVVSSSISQHFLFFHLALEKYPGQMSLGELWRKLPSMAISEPSRYAFSLLRSSICKPNQWWQRCVITTADIRICRVRISFRMFFSKRFLFHQSTSIKVDVQVTVKHDFGKRRWRTIECVLKSL